MFIFGLYSTSDDWPSDPSKKHQPNHQKTQKRPPKSSKNKMFVFGLCSTSDDWPSDLSKKHQPKHKKMKKGPLSHQKIKCLFLDYVQLLVVLLHCGCLSLNPFIEFRIQNNSSSSDVLYIQASISISPNYESKKKTTSHCHLLLHDCTNVAV